jgi:hypothetical protein
MTPEAGATIFTPRLTVYAAKFLCGEFARDKASQKGNVEGPVRPGHYATAINIHNPHPSERLSFRKKAVLLFAGSKPEPTPTPEEPKKPGRLIQAEDLPPDGGMEIDCFDIRKVLLPDAPAAPTFIKGWVIIETYAHWPLDVEAVYTAHTFRDDQPEGFAMTMERIPGKTIPLGHVLAG